MIYMGKWAKIYRQRYDVKMCGSLEEWKHFSSDNKLHSMEWGSPSQAFSTILHSLVETNMHYMWYFEFWTTTGLVYLLVSKDAETRTVHLDSGIGKLRARFQVIHRTSILDHRPLHPHHPQNTHVCTHTVSIYHAIYCLLEHSCFSVSGNIYNTWTNRVFIFAFPWDL